MLVKTINMVLVSEWYPTSNKFICEYVESLQRRCEPSAMANDDVDLMSDYNDPISDEVTSTEDLRTHKELVPNNSSILILPSAPYPKELYFKNVQNFVNNSNEVLDKVTDNQQKIDQVHDVLTEFSSIEVEPERKEIMMRKILQLKNNLTSDYRLRGCGENTTEIGEIKSKVKKKGKKTTRNGNSSRLQGTLKNPITKQNPVSINTKIQPIPPNKTLLRNEAVQVIKTSENLKLNQSAQKKKLIGSVKQTKINNKKN